MKKLIVSAVVAILLFVSEATLPEVSAQEHKFDPALIEYNRALVANWYAPALNELRESPMVWRPAELYDYLRTGGSALHGVAAGSMAEVIGGLSRASDAAVLEALKT